MEKVFLVYEISEELSAGSTLNFKTHVFSEKELMEKFIFEWNKSMNEMVLKYSFEKSNEEDNKFHKNDWVYYLNKEEKEINEYFKNN